MTRKVRAQLRAPQQFLTKYCATLQHYKLVSCWVRSTRTGILETQYDTSVLGAHQLFVYNYNIFLKTERSNIISISKQIKYINGQNKSWVQLIWERGWPHPPTMVQTSHPKVEHLVYLCTASLPINQNYRGEWPDI